MNVNKVFLAGRLTFDPELRHIPSGMAVTELRMASNRKFKGQDGEKREEVLFADVVFWGKQAEVLCQYLHKGDSLWVEGYLKMETWDDKNTGEKRSKMKIVGNEFQFAGDKKSDGDDGGRQQGGHSDRQQPQQSRGGQPQGRGPTPSRGPAPQQQRGGYAGAQGQGRGPQVDGFDRVDDDESVPF